MTKKHSMNRFRFNPLFALLIYGFVFAIFTLTTQQAAEKVNLVRMPNNGIQPQAAMDERGTLHLVYLAGDPAASDVFYIRRAPGKEFSTPIRVNSQTGSAIAIGTIRGAQIALGKNGRIHVAWNGSNQAVPRSQSNSSPMLYARMNDAGTGFEPQRNLMQSTNSLDGGGSVAADMFGNVYVVWHGAGEQKGEQHRRVWLARSIDEGRTFAREVAIDTSNDNKLTGACGCCSLRAFVDSHGALSVLYRTATEMTERGMFLLTSTDKGKTFSGQRLDNWNLTTCPMSSVTMAAASSTRNLAAWENNGQVFFAALKRNDLVKISAPGETGKRKHPAIATNSKGETILVWTEGTGWKKGGSLTWQVFDREGKPTAEKGSASDVPVWGLATVVAESNGSFSVMY